MSGAVLFVLAALGVATLGSLLLWAAPKMFRRCPPSFREQLAAVSPRPGRPVGPAGGVSALTPMAPESGSAEPARPASGDPSAFGRGAPASQTARAGSWGSGSSTEPQER